jgi:drug/metabolite transporter (DMT)-like permease
MVIGLGAALLAALLFGVAAVAQAVAARQHGLFSYRMLGVALIYVVGWLLHLVAIAQLPLYVAQVGIAVSLVVTALLAATVVGEPLEPRHWMAIVGVVGGLAMLVVASGDVGDHEFDTDRTLALYVGFAVTLVLGILARRWRSARSGVLLAVLGGIAYGGSPVATRSLVDPAWNAETVLPALTIGLFGLLGFWLYSVALARTSVTAATAPLVLLETVVPAVVGLTLFGDRVRDGWWPFAAVGFVLSILGSLVLSGAEARLEQVAQPDPGAVTERQPG